jgi:prepilin-type N-terminal cleavage/methylation domain-containing protein
MRFLVNYKLQHLKNQKGSTLIEVLVAISLFSIVGLGLAQSAQMGLLFQKRSEIGDMAKNLAISKAETLSGVEISQLNDTYDTTENSVTVSGHKIIFKRVTDITVNSDGSRTIDITISSTSAYLPQPVSYSTRFAPWEA